MQEQPLPELSLSLNEYYKTKEYRIGDIVTVSEGQSSMIVGKRYDINKPKYLVVNSNEYDGNHLEWTDGKNFNLAYDR